MTDSDPSTSPLLADQDADAAAPDRPKPRELASRACDACRARRRKCVFATGAGTSRCQGCAKLGIDCSFAIPTRQRGPKRKRYVCSVPSLVTCPPMPTPDRRPQPSKEPSFQQHSPAHHERPQEPPAHRQGPEASSNSHVGHMSASSAGTASPAITSPVPAINRDEDGVAEYYNRPLPTDELCPRGLFMHIMSDYIERIYPLIPVVHVQSFRADLAMNRDVEDLDFLALIIALAALTVGLLPSRFDSYTAIASRFGTRTAMISCCSQICLRLRPANYWDHVSHRKWAVAYTLSMGIFQTGQTNQSRMFEAEAMQVARLLGVHLNAEYVGLSAIETQLRKKAFWLQFYTFTSVPPVSLQIPRTDIDGLVTPRFNLGGLITSRISITTSSEKSTLTPWSR